MSHRPRRARRARVHRLAIVGALAIAAIPVGTAQMAANVVEPTYAGDSVVHVHRPTTLTADGFDESGRLTAVLTVLGDPLVGLPVMFALADTPAKPLCAAAVTNAAGVASCDAGPLTTAAPNGLVTYTVTFAGLGALDAATASADVPTEVISDEPDADSTGAPDDGTNPPTEADNTDDNTDENTDTDGVKDDGPREPEATTPPREPTEAPSPTPTTPPAEPESP